ncbi:SRPBCC family protein (plasmid) [Streptomyces sp. NBC_01387]|uniref:type II toxin-antitoxin system RatA family toxin n=1 Tax=unclassified Streptomyces TaxID=2593676 RepID=UPI0020254577|nr:MULTISPECIES: SRPBCC family protein [unclassified Streptomyces]MCX4554414.1 SRPBCC family protein [Streptomyces sp. NBC_01500]WSC25206.1 SRPBCC family protein [Streptomyces sp. NBC_01766]WSV58918.1 SRPBCC family protein [Streptomyces sp. NBC_01014]
MRHVELDAVVLGENARTVFESVARFDRFPELAPHVSSTTVHGTLPDPQGSSSWELHFRSGLLRWTEEDRFLEDELEIRFEQEDGDFDVFEGKWAVIQEDENVVVHFEVDFDFGIPSLEGILDPIAERVIKETVAWAVTGLFARTELRSAVELGTPADAAA